MLISPTLNTKTLTEKKELSQYRFVLMIVICPQISRLDIMTVLYEVKIINPYPHRVYSGELGKISRALPFLRAQLLSTRGHTRSHCSSWESDHISSQPENRKANGLDNSISPL